jgi:pimeloyl-ACP methyl ester carboxylesterase
MKKSNKNTHIPIDKEKHLQSRCILPKHYKIFSRVFLFTLLCPVTIAVFFTSLIFSGCSKTSLVSRSEPDFGQIYNQAAQYQGIERNPVIVIHGILGSKLIDSKTGVNVWGEFGESTLSLHSQESMRLLGLPMSIGSELNELRDPVVPDGALEEAKARVFGLPLRINAYGDIMNILGAGQYYDKDRAKRFSLDYGDAHYSCFQFAYDWRRDIAENARELEAFIARKKEYLKEEYERRHGVKDHDVQFDIVAHSMGGLIARYYTMYGGEDLPAPGLKPRVTWKGARHVDKLIMISPPNAGILETFIQLVDGVRFLPLLPKAKFEAALLGTFPSYYQLFPLTGHKSVVSLDDPAATELDLFDYDLWERMQWGLASPDQESVLRMLLPDVESPQERREIARDHLKKCLLRARRIQDALAVDNKPPDDIEFHLFASDSEPTAAVVGVDMKTGKIRVIEHAPGDSIVLRRSALFDLRSDEQWTPQLKSLIPWKSVTFIFADHLGITRDATFIDNILFRLLEQ